MPVTAVTKYFFQSISPTQKPGTCLINMGQRICHPFFWSCENLALQVIHPKDDRLCSLFKRVVAALLFGTLGIVTLPGWIGGSCIKMGGTALSGKPFLYKPGLGQESWGQTISLLSFNVCMYESGFPMLLGGVMPASHRIDRLAALVHNSNAEMVVLQELSLGPSEQLIERIKHQYPHFYTNIGGPTAWIQHRMVGPELFIASKAPIVSEPRFVPYLQGKHKLGFFCLETPACWVINAHFPEDHLDAVLEQVVREINTLKKQTGKPCILAGDLNYHKKIPEKYFFDPKGDAPTCTTALSAKMFGLKEPEIHSELDDFILVDRVSHDTKKIEVQQITHIKLTNRENPWLALSDHDPLLAQIKIGRFV